MKDDQSKRDNPKVVLVFTDIEGSTPMWERVPEAMESGLKLHNDLLRRLIAEHRGYEVKTEGDAFMVAFENETDALRWCLAAQEALHELPWPEDLLNQPQAAPSEDGLHKGFRVRMGAHLGGVRRAVDPTSGRLDFFGPVVNRAARVSAAAHGGQIIVSRAVLEGASIEDEAVHKDLGEHRLKGMERVEHLWQVLPPGLAARRFPPPRTLDPGRTNLAPHPSSFVGREADLQAMTSLFEHSRLVTLMGPGGAGKTRLACRYAAQCLHEYQPGGTWLVELGEARSLSDVLRAVSLALSVPLTQGSSEADGLEQLCDTIAGRGRMLLVMDNFEQVVHTAFETLGKWMKRAGEARFLVTSREHLRLEGEAVWEVGPLPLEGSVALFLDRARAVRRGFAPKEADAEAIEQIVQQLDGLPLAIELAAARASVMSPAAIRDKLAQRFRLLGVGKRGAPSRQATLMGAIDWSWDLLSEWEREVLAQCSVFRGGWTLEAVETVIDLSAWEEACWPVDVVQSLVEKSLIRSLSSSDDDREMRFGMYESIREYAARKLNEPEAVEARHGAFYARLGKEDVLEALHGPEGTRAFRILEQELQNLVEAANRAVTKGALETAAQAALAASEVFKQRGPLAVGIHLIESVLETNPREDLRARLLLRHGLLIRFSGRVDEAHRSLDEALVLARRLGDTRLEGHALESLGGLHFEQGRTNDALSNYEAALEAHRKIGDRYFEGLLLGHLGSLLLEQGRMDEAISHYEAALEIHRAVGNRHLEGLVLVNLGSLHGKRGRVDHAFSKYEAALEIHREVGNRRIEGIILGNLGSLHLERGRMDEALSYFESALEVHREIGNRRAEGVVLGNMSLLLQRLGSLDKAGSSYEAALEIHRKLGNRRSEGIILANKGALNLEQGRIKEALLDCEAALEVHREVGNRLAEGMVLGDIGLVYLELDRMDEARSAFDAGESVLQELSDPMKLGNLLCKRARLSLAEKDGDSARITLEKVEALAAQADAGPESELGLLLAKLRRELDDEE